MKLAQLLPTPAEGTEVINGVATIKGFEWIFRNVVMSIIGFAGIALFILLLVGGFKYLTSGGNPESVASAQKTLTYAIIGLVIIAMAYFILITIQIITGANITIFTVKQ